MRNRYEYEQSLTRPLAIGLSSHRDNNISQPKKNIDKIIYDAKYWFKKADLLVKEKKKHLDENH